jgi:hypothetical protein
MSSLKENVRDKHSSLFRRGVSDEGKKTLITFASDLASRHQERIFTVRDARKVRTSDEQRKTSTAFVWMHRGQ